MLRGDATHDPCSSQWWEIERGFESGLNVSPAGVASYIAIDKASRIEQLQSWIAQRTSIDVTHQILMTARGKQVKQQSLNQEVWPCAN